MRLEIDVPMGPEVLRRFFGSDEVVPMFSTFNLGWSLGRDGLEFG